MNRDLKAAGAVLGVSDRKLRAWLREQRLLNHEGALIASPRLDGRLYVDTRARWDYRINGYSHYGVVMVTEAGVAWLAEQLGKPVTVTQHKDSAA